MGKKGYKLKYFKEAYTTKSWMIRIFSVNNLANRDELVIRNEFDSKKYPNKLKEFKEKNFKLYNLHKFNQKVNSKKNKSIK